MVKGVKSNSHDMDLLLGVSQKEKGGFIEGHVDGLTQDCSNSIANALELLQSCTRPSMCSNLRLLKKE